MKRETDLDSIKSTARTFLYLDINESPYGTVLVQHPFTNSGLVCLQNDNGHEFVNLLKDDNALIRWREVMKDRVEECESVYQLYLLINKPYRIAFMDCRRLCSRQYFRNNHNVFCCCCEKS